MVKLGSICVKRGDGMHLWLDHLLEFSATVLVMAIIFVIYLIVRTWYDAKEEVKQIPKEPMYLCDIHGAFPAKYLVKLDVPTSETGFIELCPFCTRERVSKKAVPQ